MIAVCAFLAFLVVLLFMPAQTLFGSAFFEWVRTAAAFLSALMSLAAFYVAKRALDNATSANNRTQENFLRTQENFLKINRPWLQVKAPTVDSSWSIDERNLANVTVKFPIENIGNLPAVSFGFHVRGYPATVYSSGWPRRLEEVCAEAKRDFNKIKGSYLNLLPKETFISKYAFEETKQEGMDFAINPHDLLEDTIWFLGCAVYRDAATGDVHTTGIKFELVRVGPDSLQSELPLPFDKGIAKSQLRIVRFMSIGPVD